MAKRIVLVLLGILIVGGISFLGGVGTRAIASPSTPLIDKCANFNPAWPTFEGWLYVKPLEQQQFACDKGTLTTSDGGVYQLGWDCDFPDRYSGQYVRIYGYGDGICQTPNTAGWIVVTGIEQLPPPGPPPSGGSPPSSLAGDFNNDCIVNTADLIMLIRNWGCQKGQACFSSIYDLRPNNKIDIEDIQAEVSRRNKACNSPSS